VLNRDMLYLMKLYQATLKNPENLASSIRLLELVEIFCSRDRPISTWDDKRFEMMNNALNYFKSWEDDVEKSLLLVASKNLMTQKTRTDINSALHGIISLSKSMLNGTNSINPGYLNSDIVENLFEQRGVRNGLNSNPTLAQ